MVRIEKVEEGQSNIDLVKTLFNEYGMELGENLGFQSFDAELSDPFKKYGPPTGSLFLAYYNDQPAGCIALQKIAEEVCEMKRLYVRPAFRKYGIGDALVQALITDSRKIGYKKMVLDTLERLQPALRLYKRHGFTETTAYYDNPLPNVVYLQKEL